jgi:hypothetical protein
MFTLRIQHSVPDFDRWKQAFDSDPADRKGSGVHTYRVLRAVEDPSLVIDLDFEYRSKSSPGSLILWSLRPATPSRASAARR